ncbi:hypothetical protein Tco_0086588 [Tanacetum coccineum]
MQFLMGLDEVYVPIKSIILTIDPIPGVKGDFPTLSRDESYRSNQSHIVFKTGNGNTAFVARTNSRNNNVLDWSDILLIYKKRNGTNHGSASNADVLGSKDESFVSSNSFTNEQYKRLMALINEKSSSGSIPANIVDSGARQNMTYTILNMFNVVDVFNLNMTIGHPNGTKVVVTHTGSLKLTDKIIINDVLVVPDYQVSLLLVHKLNLEDNYKSDDPYDDGRDKESEKSKGINPTSFGVSVNPDKQDNINLKRSSWKAGMPGKLSDFHIDTKVKYNIDKHVNYSKWSEAMNLEMEALNRNNAWQITELRYSRKAIVIPADSLNSIPADYVSAGLVLVPADRDKHSC